MSQSTVPGSMAGYAGPEGRVPGRRRQKVYGYLKAANEIRQSYQSQWGQRTEASDDEQGVPGAFPDVEIVRNGDEEMVLFPSYARKHIKNKPARTPSSSSFAPGTHDDIERPETGDAEYWKKEWEKYEDDNAIVDVDVRGWIYSPHRTPMSRRNRLVVAVARRLSGIPMPASSPGDSRASSQAPSNRERYEAHSTRQEDEAAAREAQRIAQHGEEEANAAWRGGYSDNSGRHSAGSTPYGSRSNSPSREPPGPGHLRKAITDSSLMSEDEDATQQSILKRRSFNQPSGMTQDELMIANAHLMTRLKPFLTVPLTSTPITIFFFNDQKSQSRSVNTNDSGHFSMRASLDFVPTSIRVLASENLSATEKVIITEAKGVSLISDIDDTIKHSAISSGAKEIFRNTFIRDLGDLTIQGVKEWYTKMSDLGVKLHYVSNSPWQLYPLLRSYFSLAGLPSGSFHLKQYTGMLQGIFEPAAERKKGSLDKIMSDFPDRKFVLVGDSGEADLEVYTDVVLENPGRVLAVFIRDVTTPPKKKFFDQTMSNNPPDSRVPPRNGSTGSNGTTNSDSPEDRPSLPLRQSTRQSSQQEKARFTGDLIDLSDEAEEPVKKQSSSYSQELLDLKDDEHAANRTQPPNKPMKPSSLRASSSNESYTPFNHDRIPSPDKARKQPPPKPRRPSASVNVPNSSPQSQRAPFSSEKQHQTQPLPTENTSSSTIKSTRPQMSGHTTSSGSAMRSSSGYPSADDEGYAASARRQLVSAYNALPSIRSENGPSAPPLPSRRGITSYPAAAARFVTGASGGDPAALGDAGGPPGSSYNKKEEVWKRRWARAEDVMKARKVVLRSWRVGSDVMDECVGIVKQAMRETDAQEQRRGGVSESGHYRLQHKDSL